MAIGIEGVGSGMVDGGRCERFEMIQPGKNFYFLYVFGGVEAESIGPFSTEQERDNALEEHKAKEGRFLTWHSLKQCV